VTTLRHLRFPGCCRTQAPMLKNDPGLRSEPPFWKRLRSHHEAQAVIDHEAHTTLTYRELHERVQCVVEQIRGYSRSLLLLFASNDVSSIACYLAALEAGHAVFLSPIGLGHPGIPALIDAYRPELVLLRGGAVATAFESDYELGGTVDVYRLLRRRRCADEPPHPSLALVLSTSASTGSPKAVRLSAANLAGSAAQVADALAVTSTDRALLSLPLSYIYGLSVLNSSLYSGSAVALVKGTFADLGFYAKVTDTGVTTIPCVTETFEYMRRLQVGAQLVPKLRRLTHSGSPLNAPLFEWIYDHFRPYGVDIYLMYGQTEACGRITVLPPEALPGLNRSVGRAVRSGSLSISDRGEVIYQGPGVMLGYATRREDLSLGDTLHGVLCTGDLGRLDTEGNLFITGRMSRHCKVFGHRVNLDDIEGFFSGPRQAAAVEKDGTVTIFFEGTVPATSQAVLELGRRFQLPPQNFRLHSVPELPRTDRGKIAYSVLLSMV